MLLAYCTVPCKQKLWRYRRNLDYPRPIIPLHALSSSHTYQCASLTQSIPMSAISHEGPILGQRMFNARVLRSQHAAEPPLLRHEP